MCIRDSLSSLFFILLHLWKFWPQLACKYARPGFLVYLWFYLNKSEHKQPWIRRSPHLYLVSEVFRVRNKSSLLFVDWKHFSSRLLPSVCVKWRVFPTRELFVTKFNRPGNLKGLTGFKKQTELYPYKCRSKSPTLSTFSFNRLSNSNVKVRTICLWLWCLR